MRNEWLDVIVKREDQKWRASSAAIADRKATPWGQRDFDARRDRVILAAVAVKSEEVAVVGESNIEIRGVGVGTTTMENLDSVST
jgi:hypothetical protein